MSNPACTFDEHDPATIAAFWGNGRYLRPGGQRSVQPHTGVAKVAVTLRLNAEIVEYFKATGDGWPERMSGVLANCVEQQRASSKGSITAGRIPE